VIAGPGAAKLEAFEPYCPNVDILGINAYGDARLVPEALDAAGVDSPSLLTEFGPTGHWEVRTTSWGVPIEPPAQEGETSKGTNSASCSLEKDIRLWQSNSFSKNVGGSYVDIASCESSHSYQNENCLIGKLSANRPIQARQAG